MWSCSFAPYLFCYLISDTVSRRFLSNSFPSISCYIFWHFINRLTDNNILTSTLQHIYCMFAAYQSHLKFITLFWTLASCKYTFLCSFFIVQDQIPLHLHVSDKNIISSYCNTEVREHWKESIRHLQLC
jgi:hypothetical protein